MYNVMILKHKEADSSKNAFFTFDEFTDALDFVRMCFDNGYDVAINQEQTIFKKAEKPSDKGD